MLNTNINDVPYFIRILLFSMKKTYIKNTYELVSSKLCDSPPDFLCSIYYRQVIDLIKSKIYKQLPPKPENKPLENVCIIFFVEFINIARSLGVPDIV